MKRFVILTFVLVLMSQCRYAPIGSLGMNLYLLFPLNGSDGVSTSPLLEWIDPFYGDKPRKFLVYLSKDRMEVFESSEEAFVGETEDPWFEVEKLEKGSTYYWRVVGKKDGVEISSAVWSFRTNDFKVVSNKTLGSPYEDGAFSLLALHDGYVVGGYIGYSIDEYNSAGAPAVFKLDDRGEIVWISKLGENGTIYDVEIADGGKSVIAVGGDNGISQMSVVAKISTSNGKVLFQSDLVPNSTLFGVTSNEMYFVAVGAYMFGSSDSDIVVLKFDTDGNVLFKRILDYGSRDIAHDVISTGNGYVVAGVSNDNGLIILLDENLGVKSYHIEKDCNAFYKIIGIGGKYLVVGYSKKMRMYQCPDGGTTTTNLLHPCIVSVDGSGDVHIASDFIIGCTSYPFVPYSATTLDDGTVLLVGVRNRFLSENTFYEFPSHFENINPVDSDQDLMIMKITPSGSVLAYEHFGGSYEDGGFDVVEKNGDVILIGRTWSRDGCINQNFGRSDIWFLRISER